jgi:phytoene dehydrogenase-like protein
MMPVTGEHGAIGRSGDADVVVIGAGHNGLVAAAYLAAAGLVTVVLEEREVIGGNTVTEELTLPGYQHDSCSSAHVLIQANPLVRDDELGLGGFGLRYVHTDPAVVLRSSSGPGAGSEPVVIHRDVARTATEIAGWSEPDAQAFVELLDEWDGGLRTAHARWNAGRLDPHGSAVDADYARVRDRSALQVIRSRFSHPRTVDAMAWLSFATIQRVDRAGTGILPFSITAGRVAFGWATPIGGSAALPAVLARRIDKDGGQVLTGRVVEGIMVEDGRAVGVRTTDGQTWRARRAVLSSAHLTHLPAMLEGTPAEGALSGAASRWRPGLSLFAVHLATAGQLSYPRPSGPLASVAGGLGTVDGLLDQFAAFDAGRLDARDPWVLVVNSTLVDPGRAPEGRGTAKLLTIAPYSLSGDRSWRDEMPTYATALRERVAAFVAGLSDCDVLAELAESPVDLERRNRSNVGGSCHGGEFVAPETDGTADGPVLVGWPSVPLPVPGLYLTGSTAHPGGSVSGRPGRNAARRILTDLGIDPGCVMGTDD